MEIYISAHNYIYSALDYRLAPETRFPGPLHDAVSGYLRLVEDLCIPPENIILAGDSAGGGLSIALLMYLRDNGYPLPAGGIVMSPWVGASLPPGLFLLAYCTDVVWYLDLTMSCDSWDSNAPFDVVPMPAPDDHLNPVGLYLGDDIERYVTHPYVSPLFGDFKGLPPLLIQAGDAEVLRDEITLLAHKASLAGVEVRHELYEDAVSDLCVFRCVNGLWKCYQIHVFQSFPFVDATHRAFMSCRDFVRNSLPNLQERSPRLLDGTAEAKLENEIDNEKARVVRGDGVEASSGMQKAKIAMQEEAEEIDGGSDTDTEDDEDEDEEDRSSQNEYPSWRKSATRSRLPSLLSTEEVDMDWVEPAPAVATPCTPRAPPRQDGPSMPGLRRIQSALSILSQSPPSPTTKRHQRGTSINSNNTNSSASSRQRSLSYRATQKTGVSLPKLSMSSTTTSTIPSPSIRRSSTSHPDITLLVQQWANSGPANQTTMYKPHSSSTYSKPP
jgi:acetyl esterase/lipase